MIAFGSKLILMLLLTWEATAVEYKGCKEDSVEEPALAISPNFYDVMNFPKSCIDACEEADNTYAGVLGAKLCLCGNNIDGMKAADFKCMVPCPNPLFLKCGGDETFDVYEVDPDVCITGLQLSTEEPWLAGKKIPFKHEVDTPCRDLVFSINYDDEAGPSKYLKQDSLPDGHLYFIADDYAPFLKTQTEDEKFKDEVNTELTVSKTPKTVRIACPEFVKPDEIFTCNISIRSATSSSLNVNFGDGETEEFPIPDSFDIELGKPVPQAPPEGFLFDTLAINVYVFIVQGMIPRSGFITHAEIYSQVPFSKFELLVLKAVCDDGKEYCWANRGCISSDEECPLPCEDAFDPSTGTCKHGAVDSASYEENVSEKIEPSATGYFVQEISATPSVAAGDQVVLKIVAGGVSYKEFEWDSKIDAVVPDLSVDKFPTNRQHFMRAIMEYEVTFTVDHSYSKPGEYSCDVEVSNSIDSTKITNSTTVEVIAPLIDLKLELDKTEVRGDSKFKATATLENGTHYYISINIFNDKFKNETFTELSTDPFEYECDNSCHGGEGKFNVTVTASNKVNTLTDWAEIIIQQPVTEDWTMKTDSPRVTPPGTLTAELELDDTYAFPTDATAVFNWGDSEPDNELKLNKDEAPFQQTHDYSKSGDYTVTIKISNLVSNFTLSKEIRILEKINIKQLNHEFYSTKSDEWKEGLCPEKNTYFLNHEIRFFPEYTGEVNKFTLEKDGTEWDSFDAGEKISKTFDELGTYCITIYGTNGAEEKSESVESCINIVEGTTKEKETESCPSDETTTLEEETTTTEEKQKFEISQGPLVDKNETKTFTFTYNKIAPDSCLYIDFGDKSKTKTYGDEEWCKKKYEDSEYVDELANPLNFDHVYYERGAYDLKCEVCNPEICEELNDIVIIGQFPCSEPPETTFRDKVASPDVAPIYLRSSSFRFYTITDFSCECPIIIERMWRVWEIDEETKKLLDEIRLIGRTDSVYNSIVHFEPRFFEYGLYKIEVEVNFTKESPSWKSEPPPNITMKEHSFFRIIKSELVPIIIEGAMTEVERGYGQMVHLAPETYSFDPDYPDNMEGFTYEWFCYRMDNDESLGGEKSEDLDRSNVVEILDPDEEKPDDNGGCFGSGADAEIKACAFITQKGVIVNPTKRLALYSECQEECPDDVTFKYSAFKLNEEKWEKTEISDLADFSIGIDNFEIAIRKEFFEAYKDVDAFVFQSTATSGDVSVAAQLYVYVNAAPVSGTCSLVEEPPEKGKIALLSRMRVVCEGWKDPEGHEIDQYSTYIIADKLGNDNFRQTLLVAQHIFPEAEISLPCGVFDIEVSVHDNHGASTHFTVESSFEPTLPSLKELNFFLKDDWMETLVNEGRQFLLPTTFVAAKSVIDCSAALSDDEDELLLKSGERLVEFIKAYENMTIMTASDVELGVSLMAYAFGNGAELDTRAREITTRIYRRMDDALYDSLIVDPFDMDVIVTNAISAIAAFKQASADTVLEERVLPSDMEHAYEIDYSTDIDEDDFVMEQDPDKMLHTGIIVAEKSAARDQERVMESFAETISQKILQTIIEGEEDIQKEIRLGAGVFSKLTPEKKNSFSQADSSFSLPNICVLRNITDGDCAKADAVSLAGFTWNSVDHPYGKNLDGVSKDSKTIEIELYDTTQLDSSDVMEIKDLSELIDLFIPFTNTSKPESDKVLPHLKWYEFMMYHQLHVPDERSSISIEITPDNPETKMVVYIRYLKKPILKKFDFFFNLGTMTATEGAYKIFIDSTGIGNKTGNYYIGVAQLTDDTAIENIKDGTDVEEEMTYQNFTSGYSVVFFSSGCYHFSDINKLWTTDGCDVVSITTKNVHCKCNHLTSFAGGLMVAPNSIDFTYVFANANFADNLTIYCAILVTFVLYLIFMIWARRQDNKDKEKIGALPVSDNNTQDKYLYEMLIFTGSAKGASTKSKISFVLCGDKEESDIRSFGVPPDRCFRRNGVDVFVLAVPRPLGQLQFLHIWHDNSGVGIMASWNLSYIMIRDVQTGEKFEFIVNDWLSVEHSDGMIDRVIPVAGKEQLTEFGHLFSQTSNKNLSDGHIWFSVFLRPPRSRFSRCQRISSCMCILYLSMLVNAMWYGTFPEKPTTSSAVKMGPFSLSLEQISVGFFSNLIIFPVTFLIIYLFRKSRPRKLKKSRIDEAIEKQQKQQLSKSSVNVKANNTEREGRQKEKTKKVDRWRGDDDLAPIYFRKKKFTLPWWCILIAWFLCVAVMGISIFFIWAYGIQFGNEKTKKWLTSLLISFFTSILITQPIKIFFLAILFASVCKKVETDEDDADEDELEPELAHDEEWLHTHGDPTEPRRIAYKPPNPELVEAARQSRLKEAKMWKVLREMFLYLIFLWMLSVIGYGARDPNAFYVKKILDTELTKEFLKISDVRSFWNWTHNFLNPNLMADRLYNGNAPFGYKGFLRDMASRILGYGIMRQVRITQDQCKIPKQMKHLVRNCSGMFPDLIFEDNKPFGPAANLSLESYTLMNEEIDLEIFWMNVHYDYMKAFYYNNDSLMIGTPTVGLSGFYSGNGYIVHLNGSRQTRTERLQYLEQRRWINRYTRAVLIEFSVFNGQVDIFGVVKLLVEFFPGGGALPSPYITTMRYASYSHGLGYFLLLCQLTYVVYILVCTGKEIAKMCKQKKTYWTEFWNLLEVFLLSTSYAAIAFYAVRLVEIHKVTKYLKETNFNRYANFQHAQLMDAFYGYCISFIIFGGTIKFIKLLRFNKRMLMLSTTLMTCAKSLTGFYIMFAIMFMAFGSLLYLKFALYLSDFHTMFKTFGTMVSTTLNKFNFQSYVDVDPYSGPILFFCFTLSTNIFLLNIFISIIIVSFEQVKADLVHRQNEFELMDFFLNKIKVALGLKNSAPPPAALVEESEENDRLISKTKEFSEKVDRLVEHINEKYFEGKLDLKNKHSLKMYKKKKINYIPEDMSVIKEKHNIFHTS